MSSTVVRLFDEHIKRIGELSETFTGRTGDRHLLQLAALFCRILAHAQAVSLLAKDALRVAIPAQVRSQLDAYIDFMALYDNVEYWNVIHFEYLFGRQGAYQALFDPTRSRHLPAHDGLDLVALQKQLKSIKGELSTLTARGIKRLAALNRFEMAGKAALYYTTYLPLCEHVHNNLRTLVAHHIEQQGNRLHLVVRGAGEDDQALAWLAISALMSTEALELLLMKQRPGDEQELQGLLESLGNFMDAVGAVSTSFRTPAPSSPSGSVGDKG